MLFLSDNILLSISIENAVLTKFDFTCNKLTEMRLLTLVLFYILSESLNGKDICKWTIRETSPEVYWINMDRSLQRKRTAEIHLSDVGLRNFRVRGLTPKEIYIPPDVENTWRTAHCHLQTNWIPPNKLEYFNNSSPYLHFSAYTAALCGRGKGKNTPK